MNCHVLSCDVMTAMPPPAPCRPVPAYRSSIAFRSPPFPRRRWPGARAAGPLAARIARPPARVSAGAVRAPDCACARTREAGPGRTSPVPRKGAEKPTGRARRRVPIAVHGMEHNTNNAQFQPLRGDFSRATDSSRRKRRSVPSYRRPISFASVSNRRRQAGQRVCTVSGSIFASMSRACQTL